MNEIRFIDLFMKPKCKRQPMKNKYHHHHHSVCLKRHVRSEDIHKASTLMLQRSSLQLNQEGIGSTERSPERQSSTYDVGKWTKGVGPLTVGELSTKFLKPLVVRKSFKPHEHPVTSLRRGSRS